MRLTYRGIQYDSESNPLEVTEGEIAGKYRGQPWHYHYPRHIPQLQPKLLLNYRGVSYSKRPVIKCSPSPEMNIPAVNANGELPTPKHFSSRKPENSAEQAHLENIRRNLERRISVAKEKGNEELVSILKQEYQTITQK
ncbi:DUF4278 domain-containing protein [Euhalothece natronophila Z-M001]|uniref:DUF4278 domain-containing protein n=1 Tax=Euhalothece natronophila Z-M001 TaxID=522448 RepID=A0A5B8NS42_9CHRO|nr:DUF4278 domain-containing protein [Euhalothece natronophila]QDZ41065.1 DUF4278 domain-containing protein [Euhalothece natronophila Z-M001]